jgi:hypothetical protein
MFRITRAFSRWLFILFGGDQPSIMMMDSLPQSLLFQVPISKTKEKKKILTLSLRRGRAPENNEVNFYRMK